MYFFEADSRDGFGQSNNTCNSCCASTSDGIPGETNKWRISYADWLQGIRGRGLFRADFSFLKITPDAPPPNSAILPPTNTDYTFQIEANTTFSGSVATSAVSPQSTALTFALDPVNPPSHGIIAMNSNGTFIYVPSSGYTGIDSFGFVTMDGVNTPVENIVTFGVDVVVATPFATPLPVGVVYGAGTESSQQVYSTTVPPNQGLIYVDPTSVRMFGFYLDFGLTVSPECLINQIYRMTIAVQAMECNKQVFRHISSYDVNISNCGLP